MAIAAAACLSPALAAPRPAISASSSAFLSNGGNGLLAKRASLRVAGRSRRRGGGGGLEVKCLFGLGVPELAVIAGVAALVFGPKKLPEIGRSIGKTVKSFQQAAKEFETEIKKSPEELSDTPTEKPISAGENQKQENAGNLEVSSQKES